MDKNCQKWAQWTPRTGQKERQRNGIILAQALFSQFLCLSVHFLTQWTIITSKGAKLQGLLKTLVQTVSIKIWKTLIIKIYLKNICSWCTQFFLGGLKLSKKFVLCFIRFSLIRNVTERHYGHFCQFYQKMINSFVPIGINLPPISKIWNFITYSRIVQIEILLWPTTIKSKL